MGSARPASRSTARCSPTSPCVIPWRSSSSRRSPSRHSDHARPPGGPHRAAGASAGDSAGGRTPAPGSQDRDPRAQSRHTHPDSRARPEARPVFQKRSRRGGERAEARVRSRVRGPGARAQARRRLRDRPRPDHARARRLAGRPPPRHAGRERDLRHLSRAGLHPCGRAGSRDRAVQLLRAQLPQGPSRARRAGLVLSWRRPPAPHAHVAGADPHAGALPAAHPRRHSGPGVPARPVRRVPLPRVRADRGPGRRRGNQLRRFQGHPRHLRPALLHSRHPGAVPAVVLSVHRAVGRDGRAVPDLQGRGVRYLQADGLDGDPRLGAGSSRRARELRRLERAVLGLRMGHGPRAHRHDPPRHRRHPAAPRERRALPRAVRGRGPVIVSRRWLEALLGRPLDAREVAERLTMHAAAVDAVVPLHTDLGDVLIGRVLEVKKHPNADRLSLCRVDAGGAGGPVEVVCGAPNVQAGKTYPYAPVGATLPGGLKLERRKIRGVESNGMLCSAKELGLGEDHAGILELDTTAPPGSRFLDVVPVADHQIVIDVPANRPDLLCHKGVARELAAVLGGTVKLPPIPAPAGGTARAGGDAAGRSRPAAATSGVVDGVEVRLEDPEGAPRYMIAVIRGVKVAPSPGWLTGRLASIGQRSINNVVDATNYILFELNQPLHAFDLAKLSGPAVVVRRAKPGEKIVTLDGLTRTLTPDMTAICDAKRPTIIAGIMGSADSEVSAATTDLVLECAFFQPTRIRRTRRALELSSESSYRFERGIDMLGMPDALRRAIELIVAVAGGELREPPLDLWPEPQQEKTIFLRPERVAHLLGVPVEPAEIERRLTAVGFFLAPKDGRLAVQVPGWRPAVTREVDLIEAVARA